MVVSSRASGDCLFAVLVVMGLGFDCIQLGVVSFRVIGVFA